MLDIHTEPLPEKQRVPWNKGKLTGPKPPLQPKHVWAIRTRLLIGGKERDLALFNIALDSKLLNYGLATSSPCGSKTSRLMATRSTAQRSVRGRRGGPFGSS